MQKPHFWHQKLVFALKKYKTVNLDLICTSQCRSDVNWWEESARVTLGIPKMGGNVPYITRPGPEGEKTYFHPGGGGWGGCQNSG